MTAQEAIYGNHRPRTKILFHSRHLERRRTGDILHSQDAPKP